MNFKLLCCIGMGVFVAHLMVFMIIERVRTLRDPIGPPPPTPVPLRLAEEITIDPKTGVRIVNREYTVSTGLRPELYRGPAAGTATD